MVCGTRIGHVYKQKKKTSLPGTLCQAPSYVLRDLVAKPAQALQDYENFMNSETLSKYYSTHGIQLHMLTHFARPLRMICSDMTSLCWLRPRTCRSISMILSSHATGSGWAATGAEACSSQLNTCNQDSSTK